MLGPKVCGGETRIDLDRARGRLPCRAPSCTFGPAHPPQGCPRAGPRFLGPAPGRLGAGPARVRRGEDRCARAFGFRECTPSCRPAPSAEHGGAHRRDACGGCRGAEAQKKSFLRPRGVCPRGQRGPRQLPGVGAAGGTRRLRGPLELDGRPEILSRPAPTGLDARVRRHSAPET